MENKGFKELTDEELDSITGGGPVDVSLLFKHPTTGFVICGTSQMDMPAFGKCLLNNGASQIPALADVVVAIISKDWAKVKKLISPSAIKAIPIVIKCTNESK